MAGGAEDGGGGGEDFEAIVAGEEQLKGRRRFDVLKQSGVLLLFVRPNNYRAHLQAFLFGPLCPPRPASAPGAFPLHDLVAAEVSKGRLSGATRLPQPSNPTRSLPSLLPLATLSTLFTLPVPLPSLLESSRLARPLPSWIRPPPLLLCFVQVRNGCRYFGMDSAAPQAGSGEGTIR
jgi:hypothetical protein